MIWPKSNRFQARSNWATRLEPSLRAVLPEVKCPSLVIHGIDDEYHHVTPGSRTLAGDARRMAAPEIAYRRAHRTDGEEKS